MWRIASSVIGDRQDARTGKGLDMAGIVNTTEALIVALEARGLVARPTGTGGGCEALLVHDRDGGEDGFHLLVTDGNLSLPYTGVGGDVVASAYVDGDDEGTLVVDLTDGPLVSTVAEAVAQAI